MPTLANITDATFQAEVLGSELPVLVDVWAVWCGPCKAIAPLVDTLAVDLEGGVRVVKADLNSFMSTARTYGVSSIPALMLFRGGKLLALRIGAGSSLDAVRAWITECLGPSAVPPEQA